MEYILFAPPVAFLIYVGLVFGLHQIGRNMAFPGVETETKSSIYASGESAPVHWSAPGYRPFFVVALFFAVLHLGVLILGSGEASLTSLAFLVGLILALLALILG